MTIRVQMSSKGQRITSPATAARSARRKNGESAKRKLAYEIQKEKEAYYYFVQFETEDSNCPNELEHRMRIMDNVLRYLVVRKGEHDTFSVAPEKAEEAEAAEEAEETAEEAPVQEEAEAAVESSEEESAPEAEAAPEE